MGKYFTVEVKPTVTASLQQAAAFSAQDVLFDWTAFQVPKGSSRLLGATMLVRPKGDTGPTANNFGAFLVFSKTDTQSFGIINGGIAHIPSNDLLGFCEIGNAGNHMGSTMISTAVGQSGRGSIATSNAGNSMDSSNLVLTPIPTTGDNVGYDTLYVAAQAQGAFNFTSINTIQTTEAASTTIHCDGSGMDLREHFIPGDVLHTATTVGAADADSLIGTVLTVDSATNITLTDTAAVTHVDGTIIMNLNPIRLILHFEK